MSSFTNRHFPSPDPRQGQQQRLLSPGPSPLSSPATLSGSASGVLRGEFGTAYGPYSYEHTPNSRRESVMSSSSMFSTPIFNEKTATSSRQALADSASVPIYMWNADEPEDDDVLHDPSLVDTGSGDRGSRRLRQPFILWSLRGWINVGSLGILLAALLTLFVGYPVILHFLDPPSKSAGFNLGGINGSGQIPNLPGLKTLIDEDTPQDARSRIGSDGKTYSLVFSDEFETPGRSFYPGDDPYWEAQDFHYWATGDLEWYDPKAVTTEDGKLVFTLSNTAEHDLNYTSAMLTSWNKVCFTTGYVEVSVSLPGAHNVSGLWPGIWTMGNLGKAGFGATTDGLWPYTYDSCDVGTFPGQRDKEGNPQSSATDGWEGSDLSTTSGQRLSACTCPGSDHPGPTVSRGRGAPELDVLEGQVDESKQKGEVSQSFQIAPFNAFVKFANSSPETTIIDDSQTFLNSFTGNTLQQSVSAVTYTDDDNYNGVGYGMYGVEWWSDMNNRNDGHVTWYATGKESWKITSASIGPDATSDVDQRLIPEEPMYIIMNLGISSGFSTIDFANLQFPAKMYVEYVRVYQRDDATEGVTCNPSEYPTADYIANHPDAYTNVNWTTWNSAGYLIPRNSEYDGC